MTVYLARPTVIPVFTCCGTAPYAVKSKEKIREGREGLLSVPIRKGISYNFGIKVEHSLKALAAQLTQFNQC